MRRGEQRAVEENRGQGEQGAEREGKQERFCPQKYPQSTPSESLKPQLPEGGDRMKHLVCPQHHLVGQRLSAWPSKKEK